MGRQQNFRYKMKMCFFKVQIINIHKTKFTWRRTTSGDLPFCQYSCHDIKGEKQKRRMTQKRGKGMS